MRRRAMGTTVGRRVTKVEKDREPIEKKKDQKEINYYYNANFGK